MMGNEYFLVFLIPALVYGASTPRTYDSNVLYKYNVFDEELHQSILDPETCRRHRRDMQGYEFFDVSFRSPQGLLKWNWYSLGKFRHCLEIRQELSRTDHVEGKYCIFEVPVNLAGLIEVTRVPTMDASGNVSISELNFNFDVDSLKKMQIDRSGLHGLRRHASKQDGSGQLIVSLEFGICMPKACSVNETLRILDVFNIEYKEILCRVPGDKPFVPGDYVAIAVFSFIGILTLLSTSYDVYHKLYAAHKKTNPLLKSFSVYTNTKCLLDLRSTNSLDCLDGIRSISILWVVVGHTFTALFAIRLANSVEVIEFSREVSSLWVMSANNSVDTFFTIGGLLLVYTAAKKMKKDQLLKKLHMFYLSRYLRMFPLLAAAVLLQVSIFHRISDGANWDTEGEQVMFCRQFWWSALLHTQNIVNSMEICLPHTWYLSVDFQLYLLSPLLLYWLLRGPKIAWISIIIATIIVNGANIYYSFTFDFLSVMWQFIFRSSEELDRYTIYYYNNTLPRISPFVVGMSCGYFLHITRGAKVQLPKWVVALGYTLSGSILMGCIYVVNVTVQPDKSTQLLDNIINSFMKPAWAFSVCWFIFACANGYGGPINWFLSLKIWKFVARISYSMYIFHYPIQFLKASAYNEPFDFKVGNIFNAFTSDLTYTLIVSTALYIIIDAPCSTILKLIMEGPRKPREPKQEELKETPVGSGVETEKEEYVKRL